MRLVSSVLALSLAACATTEGGDDGDLSLAVATVTTTTTPPADGQCTHIVATRLSDFQISEYKGPLTDASLTVRTGEHRVLATAYSQPCNAEPAVAPWVADQQIVTFGSGANQLQLNFRKNALADILAQFIDEDTLPLVVRDGTRHKTGRNGEDIAGSGFALDGWNVSQIALPPNGPSETFLFSTEGTGLPYTARGMAHTPGGLFVFQMSESYERLFALSGGGVPAQAWTVVYPDGTTQPTWTDGLDAIDDDHFVRTAFFATPPDGRFNAIEILEKRVAIDGSIHVECTAQIFVDGTPAVPMNEDYPLAVTPVGNAFALVTIPAEGGSRIVLVDANGAVLAGPVSSPESFEGLLDDGTRLVAASYSGHVVAYDRDDLDLRAGEEVSYTVSPDFSTGTLLTYRNQPGAEQFIAFSLGGRLVTATTSFDAVQDLVLEDGALANITGLEVDPASDQLAILRRSGGQHMVRFYSLVDGTLVRTVPLAPGAAAPIRSRTMALAQNPAQIVSHYRRPAGAVDATLDAVAFVNDMNGNLVQVFDLAPYGFVRINSVNYLAATDELLFQATDLGGTNRLVVTSRTGQPRRSYRTDGLPSLSDLAELPGGDLGVLLNQPSEFARIALP